MYRQHGSLTKLSLTGVWRSEVQRVAPFNQFSGLSTRGSGVAAQLQVVLYAKPRTYFDQGLAASERQIEHACGDRGPDSDSISRHLFASFGR